MAGRQSARYDVAVIGAGSAGVVVAARLSEDPSVTVGLVEAGPDYPDFEDLPDELKYGRATAAYVTTHGHLWGYLAQATDRQGPTPLPRGKVVGGTSAVNGQVFLRALPADFARWTAAGNDGWSFDDVLPAFRAVETDLDFRNDWHGSTGPVQVRRYPSEEWLPAQRAFVDACVALGHGRCDDANAPSATGVGTIPFNNAGGIRASTAVAYLAPARDRANLAIHAETFVRRIVVAGGRAVALEVESPGGAARIEADEYVLSAGAVGSPQLLLLSGIGPAAALERAGVPVVLDLPGVGEALADHQIADLVWQATSPEAGSVDAPRLQVALRYSSGRAGVADDMQLTIRSSAPGHGEDTVSIVPSLQLPAGTGRLSITSADPHKLPRIELRFLDEEADLARLRDGVRLSVELAENPRFRGVLGRRLEPSDHDLRSDGALDDWLRRRVRTSHHVCGTCRMGPTRDPASVVGSDGRVHGLGNLRVADASIFPSVIGANPNATTMMVGERMGGLVKGP